MSYDDSLSRINIMFLLLSLNIGGTEKHLFQLITNLDKRKFNPIVCCLYDLGSIGKVLKNDEKIKVYHNLLKSKWDISGIWKLINLIKRDDVRILYTINTPLTQFWGTIVAISTGINARLTRVTTIKPTSHAKRRRIINKFMLPFVNRIIAQADSHKEYLVKNECFDYKKVEVVFNGIETEPFEEPFNTLALRRELGIPADSPIIGIVARLVPVKGHAVLLKVARKVVTSFHDVRFLIIGDGIERDKLEILTDELMIHSNVHFLGHRKDIPQILSLLDIAVMSSRTEAFPNAILEYMASSKPVVATDAGSTAEIVIDGETGYVVPCGDSDALADAILKLLNNRKLAKEMGDAGRERVKEKFTVQKMITKYESLFSDMVNNP